MKTPTKYRVEAGRFYVNDEWVAVNPRLLRICLSASGLDPARDAELSEKDGERVLRVERARLLAWLAAELRQGA